MTACYEFFTSAVIRSNPPNQSWLFSGVYSPTDWNWKEAFWRDLASNSDRFNGPWLCAGDFNSILPRLTNLVGVILLHHSLVTSGALWTVWV